MRGRFGAPGSMSCLVSMLCLAACSGVRPPGAPAPPDGKFVAGYHAWWTGDSWDSYPFDLLDRLYFFEIEARADGTLERHGWPERWQPLLDRASSSGVPVTPTVSMHDAEGFELLFSSEAATDSLTAAVLALLRETPDAAGIHLDFEVFRPVVDEARAGYSDFVGRLGDRMKADFPGRLLSVFTLAFDIDDAYDEPALAAHADYLVVQGYDYHSAGSERAGPVAATEGWGSLNWSTVLDRFDAFGVPRRKLVMAVPLYGYEWPVESGEAGAATRGGGVTIPLRAAPDVRPELPRAEAQALLHGVERDSESGTPWYRYRASDGWRQGWFEDSESLRRKFDFVRREGAGGIAFFPLAYGSRDVWDETAEAFGRGR